MARKVAKSNMMPIVLGVVVIGLVTYYMMNMRKESKPVKKSSSAAVSSVTGLQSGADNCATVEPFAEGMRKQLGDAAQAVSGAVAGAVGGNADDEGDDEGDDEDVEETGDEGAFTVMLDTDNVKGKIGMVALVVGGLVLLNVAMSKNRIKQLKKVTGLNKLF